jgi:hypothetical protein
MFQYRNSTLERSLQIFFNSLNGGLYFFSPLSKIPGGTHAASMLRVEERTKRTTIKK